MKISYHYATLLCTIMLSLAAVAQTPDKAYKNMKWRPIGPANMGGRTTDIEGIPGDPSTFYIGGADGGVFKTTNGGVTMTSLFTDQRAYSIGDIAIAPSDHERRTADARLRATRTCRRHRRESSVLPH